MSIYDEMQVVAQGLLTEFKQGIVSYLPLVVGTGPIDNPGPPASPPEPFVLAGATVSGVTKKYVDMGLAVATDLQVIAPVDARFTPNIKGFIFIDNVKHKILKIDQKPAAGTPVVFVYVVHKGP